MAEKTRDQVPWPVSFYSFALFNWFLYLGIAIFNGSVFKKNTEQDKLQLAIARDQFWNLSKSPLPNFVHRFYTLRDGVKLHYITNRLSPQASASPAKGNLAIFLHGFPDSYMVWRHLLQTKSGQQLQQATVVCVDLPGYGGSDSMTHYGPDEVLEAIAEFVVAMREMYLEDQGQSGGRGEHQDECKTYIVGHDWGCVLAMRLAAEAPCLADRFILLNGPHPELALANKDRILNSSLKIFKQFRQNPSKNWACLSKAFNTVRPLLLQLLLFGYIAVFHLPAFMVKTIGVGGNFAFLRGAYGAAYRRETRVDYKEQESLACTFGPGPIECESGTSEAKPETYGKSVLARAESRALAFMHHTAYYRDGAAFSPWNKSLETIADLHHIESNNATGSPLRRRSSSTSGLFTDHYRGGLRAPTTILWGQRDQACGQAICLDGIGDYLCRDSEVILLPRTGHWTPIERESRGAIGKVLEWFVVKGNVVGSVEGMVKEAYEGARVVAKK